MSDRQDNNMETPQRFEGVQALALRRAQEAREFVKQQPLQRQPQSTPPQTPQPLVRELANQQPPQDDSILNPPPRLLSPTPLPKRSKKYPWYKRTSSFWLFEDGAVHALTDPQYAIYTKLLDQCWHLGGRLPNDKKVLHQKALTTMTFKRFKSELPAILKFLTITKDRKWVTHPQLDTQKNAIQEKEQ
jgi:hypothetical protein